MMNPRFSDTSLDGGDNLLLDGCIKAEGLAELRGGGGYERWVESARTQARILWTH
jgi:hypothetical protein